MQTQVDVLWSEILESVAHKVDTRQYSIWIRKLNCISLTPQRHLLGSQADAIQLADPDGVLTGVYLMGNRFEDFAPEYVDLRLHLDPSIKAPKTNDIYARYGECGPVDTKPIKPPAAHASTCTIIL